MTSIFKSLKKHTKETVTLDTKHKEILSNFRKDSLNTKPELEKEQKLLNLKLTTNNLSIDERIAIGDKLNQIKMQLKTIKKSEKEYLLNNSQYIFTYFENKKNIAECKNKTTVLENFFNNINDDTNQKEISYVNKYLSNVNESCLDINNYTIEIIDNTLILTPKMELPLPPPPKPHFQSILEEELYRLSL